MLKHENVINLIEILSSNSKIYLVFEYIDGGELYSKLDDGAKISEKKM